MDLEMFKFFSASFLQYNKDVIRVIYEGSSLMRQGQNHHSTSFTNYNLIADFKMVDFIPVFFSV